MDSDMVEVVVVLALALLEGPSVHCWDQTRAEWTTWAFQETNLIVIIIIIIIRALDRCMVTVEQKKVRWEVLLLHIKVHFVHYDSSRFIILSPLFVFPLKSWAALWTKCLSPRAGNVTILPQEVKSNTFQEMLFQRRQTSYSWGGKKLHFAVNVSNKENISSLSATLRRVSEDWF